MKRQAIGLEQRLAMAQLLIVGTGPVARALVSVGEAAGFHVRVAAGPRSPSVGEFAGADELIVTPAPHDVEALRPDPDTCVVVCGHDEEFCKPVVKALSGIELGYLGVVGSRRHDNHAVENDVGQPTHVRWPAGIDIGAQTPEEIAVSVIADIFKVRNAGS